MTKTQVILMDACALISCNVVGILNQLFELYRLETVTKVIEEAKSIPSFYQKNLASHQVTAKQLTQLRNLARKLYQSNMPMTGEVHLWAHALARPDDNWLICGPDRDLVMIGCVLGLEHKIVSVEQLLRDEAMDKEAKQIIRQRKHLSINWQDETTYNIKSTRTS